MQALAGTGFLTEKARRSIKDTIESRYQASKSSYENLYGQYTGGINNLTRTSRRCFTDWMMPLTELPSASPSCAPGRLLFVMKSDARLRSEGCGAGAGAAAGAAARFGAATAPYFDGSKAPLGLATGTAPNFVGSKAMVMKGRPGSLRGGPSRAAAS
jgi:hypothetical protein